MITRVLAPRLRTFEAVARTEHITRAAEELGVPQPTVSRSLARLQEELGVVLVERTGRGVRLTRAGAVLLPHARRALNALAAGGREVAEATATTVTLAFLPTLGAEVVPALIRGFRQRYPEARFTLFQDVWAASVGRLREGSVDVALTSPLPGEPDLEEHMLHRQPLRLVVPDSHPLAQRDRVGFTVVATEPLIALKHGRGLRHLTDELCHRAGFEPQVAFEGDETHTVRGLVAAGLGVAVLPAHPHGLLPGTAELAIDTPGAHRTIGLVRRIGQTETPAVAAFRSFVINEGPRLLAEGLG
ncbi:transcriptional regulator [Nocardiopsis ansamitocini]|uniref:Transcriptional regulator n=1 Tax=Nocardiopsis ansamitocini TaxID=1670832 RepID=A0A9W6UGK7_9ACTN|nr:transcriptional regulator [Nocardiopsis ansamitocini]